MAPHRLENPVKHLLAKIKANAPRQIIGLAGLPGAGKSTFAAHLAAAVNAATAPDTMMALGKDGFHFSQAQLRQFADPAAAFARRGAPWTFDAAALLKRLRELRATNHAVSWPDFEHEIGDPIEVARASRKSHRAKRRTECRIGVGRSRVGESASELNKI